MSNIVKSVWSLCMLEGDVNDIPQSKGFLAFVLLLNCAISLVIGGLNNKGLTLLYNSAIYQVVFSLILLFACKFIYRSPIGLKLVNANLSTQILWGAMCLGIAIFVVGLSLFFPTMKDFILITYLCGMLIYLISNYIIIYHIFIIGLKLTKGKAFILLLCTVVSSYIITYFIMKWMVG